MNDIDQRRKLSRQISNRVDENRLWQRHMELARFGGTPRGGVNRQALSDEEIGARGQLVAWGRSLGLSPSTDGIGNLFLRLEGEDPSAPPVLSGSHIDSQPTGGKFDGTFGVLASLESLEVFRELGLRPTRSIELVAWTNEEGSRFSPGMMGSEAFAGLRLLSEILNVTDRAGISVNDALTRVLAANDDVPLRPVGFPLHAFVEAHIEQGPILEARGIPIGVVTGIQGTRRYRVRVTGEESHAGTTPRRDRKDALASAAAIISTLHNAIRDEEDIVKFTVGMLHVTPNAPSVVPSEAYFSLDLRHPEPENLERHAAAILRLCHEHAGPCDVEISEIARAESLFFPEQMRDLIRSSADELGIPNIDIYSAAGHDARQLHKVCPTGMIFVPCEKGISHNEAENATPTDLASGARVLAATLYRLAS